MKILVASPTMNSLKVFKQFLVPCGHMNTAIRNTWILKRKYEPYLSKLDTDSPKRLRSKHMLYDKVDNLTNRRNDPISVLLTEDVEGIGLKGTVVEATPQFARKKLLLPTRGVYVTPENLEKYERKDGAVQETDSYSSPFAAMTLRELSTRSFPVVMHGDNRWTIEKWHLQMALREYAFIVPDDALEFPREGQISGPNPEFELKEFFAYITINKKEKTPVRFRIEHFFKEIERRPVREERYWETPAGDVFPEDKPVLDELRHNYEVLAKEKVHARAAKRAAENQ